MIAGAAGAAVSTRTVRVFDAPEVFPAASVALAVYVCEPSVALSVSDQVPPAVAVVVPRWVAPSETVIVALPSGGA